MEKAIPYDTKSHGTIQKRWPYVSALSRSATYLLMSSIHYQSCGILHYDTLIISSLYHWLGIAHLRFSESHLSCLTALTSEAYPNTGFIIIFIFKFEFHIYFYFQIWILWSSCFLYKPMWWWGCNKFSKDVFDFLVNFLSFDLNTWNYTIQSELLVFHFAREYAGFFFHFPVLGFWYICVFQRDSSYHF